MKKIIALLMVACMIFSFAACQKDDVANNDDQTASDSRNEAENKEDAPANLVIGYTIYEPMNYMENGKLTGFDTEFAEAVCKKLDLTPEFVEINWDTKFVTLDSKKIDCIWNGMTISEEVKANCDVSKAYVKNAQVVVMAKDKIANYKDIESLKGLRFAAEAGSAGETAIKESGLDGAYSPVPVQTDALLAVMGGQADACVIDITMAKSMTAEGTSYDKLGYSLELTSEEYGIGFRKGDELKKKVNDAIDELKADGTLDKLAEKYSLNLAF